MFKPLAIAALAGITGLTLTACENTPWGHNRNNMNYDVSMPSYTQDPKNATAESSYDAYDSSNAALRDRQHRDNRNYRR